MRMGSWVFLWTCLQPNESAFCRLFCPKNGSSSKVLFNRPPKNKTVVNQTIRAKVFLFWVICDPDCFWNNKNT